MILNDGDNVVQLVHRATTCDIGAKPPGTAQGTKRHRQCGTLILFPRRMATAPSPGPALPSQARTIASASSRIAATDACGPAREPVVGHTVRNLATTALTQQREAIERAENEGMRVAPV